MLVSEEPFQFQSATTSLIYITLYFALESHLVWRGSEARMENKPSKSAGKTDGSVSETLIANHS